MTKRILITGTSSGFGNEAAIALAQHGHTVFATMREADSKNAPAVHQLRDMAKRDNLALHIMELDVTSNPSVQQAAAYAVEQAGGIDVLINNASMGVMGIQETVTPEQVQRLFDVNVFGIIRVNRAALPYMRQQGKELV